MFSRVEDSNNNEVSHFLAASSEFNNIQKIAKANPSNSRYANWVNGIKECSSLVNILELTIDINPATTDNIVAYNLGRDSVNKALFVAGFFSSNANFTYYLFNLREKVEAAYIEEINNQLANLMIGN